MAQKLVIPRGIIDPGETTVINIPNNLRGSSVVIARKAGPGSPGSGPDASFHTPPPRGQEHPSLDYPAFMEDSPDLPSFYRVLPEGENWNRSWGPMPERKPKVPCGPPQMKPEGAPDLPIDYWSPTKRSTPCYRPGFNTQDLNAPRRRLFGDDSPPNSPIVSRAQTFASTLQPKTRDFPSTIYDRSELGRVMDGSQDQSDSAEENIAEEESDAEEEEAERLHALDQLEFVENDTLVQDLMALQRERRKVVYDLANMEPARKSSLKKLLAPLKALKKLKKKMMKKKKNKAPQ